jgi:UTP:GlnB (protein PII) uridylyltransferase
MAGSEVGVQEEPGLRSDPADEELSSFLATMPDPYPERHPMEEMRAHAAIVSRRSGALVHLETYPGPSGGEDAGTWLCVVTDDRPGLLSLLSAAIAAHSLDILNARVYTRARAGAPDEAVDLFAVRRLGASPVPIGLLDLASIRKAMVALLRGELPVERLKQHAAETSKPGRGPETAIYFHSTEPDLLLVQTSDHPGLLLEITLTIFRERLSIIRSHITTIAGLAHDEFELAEIDGSPLSDARREAVIEKLRGAITGGGEAPAREDALGVG